MALKFKLTPAEHTALADPVKVHYTETDGAFVLQAEGLADPHKLAEFRESNRKLNKDLEELRGKFKDLDPDEARSAIEAAKKKPGPGGDDLQAQIKAAVEAETKKLHGRIQTIETEKAALKAKNDKQSFTAAISDAATKVGVQGDYLEDVLARASAKGFRVVEDGIKARKGEKFDEPVTLEDGQELTLDGFLKGLPRAFYGETRGSGPPGSGGSAGGIVSGGALYNPDPLAFGRNAEKIAKGDLRVIRSS